jgi:tetratricopeptide (TPR) repeat protein
MTCLGQKIVGCALLLALLILSPAMGQRTKRAARKPAPDLTTRSSPSEALEKARSAASQDERIALLEKFIVANAGSELEGRARELLMREYALRGEQRFRQGDVQLGMRDFRSVLRTATDPISDRVFSQYIFPLPIAVNAFGYRSESVELMRSFEKRFENDPNRLVQIGFFYIQIEAPLEAVRVLERAVQLAPLSPPAHNGLGTAYLINLRLEDAEAEFRRALELDARDEYANLNLANMLRARGLHEQAIEYYRKQIKIKPADAEAHAGMAISLIALGRDQEAEAAIKRASELGPENYRLFVQLAYIYAARKKYVPARAVIERAARIEPRYGWTFIVKANIDALEGKFGNALATMLQAQNVGKFPTVNFELAKALMSLDGYDQALEVLNRSFTITPSGEIEAMLGGVMKARSPRFDLLLARERQAAIFLNEQLTTPTQYRLAEALLRIEHYMNVALAARAEKQQPAPRPRASRRASREATEQEPDKYHTLPTRPRRVADVVSPDAPLSAGRDASLPAVPQLLQAITTFTTLDDGRQAFRAVWVARKLTEKGLALDAAEQLARRAIGAAESATEPEDSMRDAPLLDRQGRRAVFLGRAEDVLGWALLKKGNVRAAIEHLSRSVTAFPPCAERKDAMWHLAVAMEEAGDEQHALDFYIASYDPDLPTSSARRSHIEALYRKLNGSLAGLEERLKQQGEQ